MLHHITRGAAAAAVLLAGSIASIPAQATTVIPFDTEDLSHLSDVIVVAEIENVRVMREGSTRSILTHNMARVVEVWKGDVQPGQLLDVVEAGGLVDGKGYLMEGTAGYLTSEKVVLFLETRRDNRSYLTVGMNQGKLTVLSNGDQPAILTRHTVRLDDRGARFDAKKIAPIRIIEASDVSNIEALETRVKQVVEADQKAGVRGKDLPKYKGIGR